MFSRTELQTLELNAGEEKRTASKLIENNRAKDYHVLLLLFLVILMKMAKNQVL